MLDPRQLFVATYGIDRRPPQVEARALDVEQAAGALHAWFRRLKLPLLQQEQRLQLYEAGLAGIPMFIQAYGGVLTRNPRLSRALQIGAGYMKGLGDLYRHLLRIELHAGTLHVRCIDARRLLLSRIKEANDSLLAAAARLAAEHPDAGQRDMAQAVSDLGTSHRARRQEPKGSGAAKETGQAAGKDGGQEEAPAGRRGRRATPEADPLEEELAEQQGTELQCCLLAPIGDYAACADELEGLLDGLKVPPLSEKQRQELDRPDTLLEGDLLVLLMDILPQLPWLLSAAAVDLKQMEEMLQVLLLMDELGMALRLLNKGAGDGLLATGGLALVVHEQAKDWVAAQPLVPGDPDPEVAQAELEVHSAYSPLRRSKQRLETGSRRVAQKLATVEQETAAKLERARYDDILARIKAKKEVSEEETYWAKDYRDRLEADERRRAAQARRAAERKPGAPRKGKGRNG